MIDVQIAEMNPHELACRIAEAAIGIKRPMGMTAEEALKDFERHTNRDTIRGFYRAAWASAKYLEECINTRSKVNVQ